MSGIDDWSDPDQLLYAVGTRTILDDMERKQQKWRKSWALDCASADEMTCKHNARMRELEEQHKASRTMELLVSFTGTIRLTNGIRA